MIDAEQVQHGGVQVMYRADAFNGMVAVFVGGTVGRSRLDPTARQPEAEAERIVVPAVRALHERRPAEFTGKDHQGLVEQSPRLEVLQEPRYRLVDRERIAAVAEDQVRVLVPRIRRIALAAIAPVYHRQLDKAHAALDQPPGGQALQRIVPLRREGRIQPVEPSCRLGLAAEIDQFRHRRLHVVGGLVVLDRGFDLRVAGCPLEVHRV